MTYQDRWVKGTAVARGQRDCQSRYGALRPILGRFKRRFSVLDIGADHGYFGIRIAEDYDAAVTMIDEGPQLAESCAENDAPVVAIRRRITPGELHALAACEHFDVVLAFNVLHHFEDWRGALTAVRELGDVVVIETPPPNDTKACGQHAIAGLHEAMEKDPRAKLLTQTQSHTGDVLRPMYVINPERFRAWDQASSYIDAPPGLPAPGVTVQATEETSVGYWSNRHESRAWIPGINLRTYQRLGGVWPPPHRVAAMVRGTEIPEQGHHDIFPWNFILDGQRVHLIDGRDDKAIYEDDAGNLERVALEIEAMS